VISIVFDWKVITVFKVVEGADYGLKDVE